MLIENDDSQIVVTSNVTPDPVDTAATDVVDNGAPDQGQEPQEPKTFTQEDVDKIIGAEKAKLERKIRREQTERDAAPRPTTQPKPEDFTNAIEYAEALANHKAEQIVANREAQKQQNAVIESYAEREDAAREKYSDFEAVAYSQPKDGGPSISDAMAEVIRESEIGPDIAYWLGKNTAESKRIFALKPLAQAREIGKIEASLSTNPSARKVSSAPEPIKPVGARSPVQNFDPTDPRSSRLTDDEWMQAREKQIRSRK